MSKQSSVYKIWADFFKEKGLHESLVENYLQYVDNLLDNDVPIIFDFRHLCLLLGRSSIYLASVVNSPKSHYRSFNLLKRSGSVREISAPYPALLEMQNWIFENILKTIPINSSAHGFANNKSIVTNARVHAGQKELLKLDIVDFFPSININRIIYTFKSLGYTTAVSFYLASICSFNEHLPQGAPTSPILSNIISKQLDKRLIKLAKRFKLRYSRYADDMTFSGDRIPAIIIEYVKQIVIEEGFLINDKKTRLYKSKGKRIVTGVSVSDKVLKLPRSYKRELHQELNFIFKYGIDSHVRKLKIRKVKYLSSLIGKVSFWLMIEPDSKFAKTSKSKLLEIKKSLPVTPPKQQ